MIDTIYLEIIILMISVNLFENKIMPQTLNMFLAIAMLINQVQTATNLQSMIGILILYASVILYAAIQIYTKNDINTHGE